jgi:hypothetical protein
VLADRDGRHFNLIVELKFDATFGAGQPSVYLTEPWHVVAVVRKLADAPAVEPDQDRWLGVVPWRVLRPPLWELPVEPARLREQWLDLLRVMDDDGDFDEVAPAVSRGVEDSVRWFKLHCDELTDELKAAIQGGRHNGAGRGAFAENTRLPSVRPAGDWARARFKLASTEPRYPIVIGLRPAYMVAPELSIEWFPWPQPGRSSRGARRRWQEAHQRLRAAKFVPNYDHSAYRRREPLSVANIRIRGVDAAVGEEFVAGLAAIAESGVLSDDIETFRRTRSR